MTERPSPPADLQARIDSIHWYHEMDLGNGLRSVSREPDVALHRPIWRFIEAQLAEVDLRGKSVLDVGCWDGHFSFLAERAGAKSVLATDDLSQSWSDGGGLLLARELLGSRVEVRQHVSIYDLGSLGRTFDVIFCFGIYYHLRDPFFAFTQLRHCCQPGSLVLVEGDIGATLDPHTAVYRFAPGDRGPGFLPSAEALASLLDAAYLSIDRRALLHPIADKPLRWLRRTLPREAKNRIFCVCRPHEGINESYTYRPPFGLARYDPRFRD